MGSFSQPPTFGNYSTSPNGQNGSFGPLYSLIKAILGFFTTSSSLPSNIPSQEIQTDLTSFLKGIIPDIIDNLITIVMANTGLFVIIILSFLLALVTLLLGIFYCKRSLSSKPVVDVSSARHALLKVLLSPLLFLPYSHPDVP